MINSYGKLAPNIEKHPRLKKIYREPPIISYKRGKSLKYILLTIGKAKRRDFRLVNPIKTRMHADQQVD